MDLDEKVEMNHAADINNESVNLDGDRVALRSAVNSQNDRANANNDGTRTIDKEDGGKLDNVDVDKKVDQ